MEILALQHFGDQTMKKTQVALAAMALVASTAALADGVTVYGVLDVGLQSVNNGTNTTRTFGGGGTESPSLFGVKGSEDLGNGMKASFNLEAGFNTGNGAFDNGSYSHNSATPASGSAVATSIFGRAANVAIAGDFGTVTAGVHMDPAFLAALAVDPRGMGNGSGTLLNFWGYTGPGTNPNLLQGIFNGNSVMYTSPNVNGLQGSASYGMGTASGSRQDGSQSIGLTYGSGSISASAWRNTIYSDAANTKAVTNQGIGFGLAISETLSIKAHINKVETYTSGAVSAERNSVGFGGTYALQDNLKLTMAYYTRDNNMVAASDNNMWVTNLSYGITPRTSAYITYVNENTKAETGTFASSTYKNGSKAAVGILHSF